MWTILQIDDAKRVREVARIAYAVIEDLNGEVINGAVLCDVIIRAAFPHRQAKRLERAFASAVSRTPVTCQTVYTTDPFAIPKPRKAAC
jgi:hypothetical protein